MGKTFNFWWMCAKRAARGSSAFANDWQWLIGYPATAASLWILGYFYAELSGRIEVTLATGALGALAAAFIAYIITWSVSFVGRLLNVPVAIFFEQKEMADTLQQELANLKNRNGAKDFLHQYYAEICDLFNESIPEEDFDQYTKRCYEILSKQATRIENELGAAARVKFLDRIAIKHGFFSKSKLNKDYNQLLLELNRIKDNLGELIKSEVWNSKQE
jgi:hypothetical protein